MSHRREFIATLTRAGLAVPAFRSTALASVLRAEHVAAGRAACVARRRRSYWGEIQRAFDADRTLINLNNGGVSPTPTHVLEAMIRDLRFSNEVPVEHMWGVLEPRIESVRRELAKEFGCDTEEMAITRNASESNEIMILGLDLKRGDEVIVTTQNYGRMLTTWDQRARRDGIVVKHDQVHGAAALRRLHRRIASARRSRRGRASSRSRTSRTSPGRFSRSRR